MHRIAPALPPRKLGPSLGTDIPLPSPRVRITPSRATEGKTNISDVIRRRQSYSNRQAPRPITWSGQRSQMMRRLLPRQSLAMVQIHLRRRSSTLRLKRNRSPRPLSLSRKSQSPTRVPWVSRLVGCALEHFWPLWLVDNRLGILPAFERHIMFHRHQEVVFNHRRGDQRPRGDGN